MNAQTQTKSYTGNDTTMAQAKFQNDLLIMQSQGWQVVGNTTDDRRKGSAGMFWLLILLGFVTLITFFIAPFAWPRGEVVITATYQR